MAEYDLVIRGGAIVDGTGVPRHRADLAVKSGRIAMISGRIRASGGRELDASGCVVAPGAIDLHTHYDAQLGWDPYASLSGWFGVTSLTIGHCGLGPAPTRPQDRDLSMRMVSRVQGIPLESLRQGMRWDWETFPQYLNSLGRWGLGVNVGALLPFSPLRGYVLGMVPARERRSVTVAELDQMKQAFYEAMRAGAFGFSAESDVADQPQDDTFLPSRVASREEFLALAEVLSLFGVGHIVWRAASFQHQAGQQMLLEQLAQVSGRPLQVALADNEGFRWLKDVRGRGLPVVARLSPAPAEAEDPEPESSQPAGFQEDNALADRLKSPFVLLASADSGAHSQSSISGAWPVHFLAHWVRDREIMTLEQAHYKISAYPAWCADLKDRGVLRVGAWADIIVYNLERLGYLYHQPIFATDFPGGERRLVQKPAGLRYTIVNGAVTFEENNCTGALPGKLLRSYDMVG